MFSMSKLPIVINLSTIEDQDINAFTVLSQGKNSYIIFAGIQCHGLILLIVAFIEHKIDTNPLMRLSPRRESPGTDMGRHLKRYYIC